MTKILETNPQAISKSYYEAPKQSVNDIQIS
jgi:hypothetical protein